MRFAAIADIHGNALALEAVLADIAAQGISDVVNLGDHFSGPLDAGRTADILMARGDLAICGNHDRWLIEQSPDQMGISDLAAHQKLGAHHLDWLRALPATATRDDVFLCHGTPGSDTTYWLEAVAPDGTVHGAPRADFERRADGISQSLILCAHTHLPRSVHLTGNRMIVNPGSVGCPGYTDDAPVFHKVESGSPDARYAILEHASGRWSVTFRNVPYDHMAAAQMAENAGRPDWASALATGWID
ncbi:MAG: metallophosphoesterase family protein [Pseudomonadota bacterium]